MRYAIFASLMCLALVGCKQDTDYRFMLEKMPAEYRKCAAEVVTIPKGPISQKDLIRLTAELKAYGHRQNRCLRGAIAWADAQWKAYYQQY